MICNSTKFYSNGNVEAAIGLFFETGLAGLEQQQQPVEPVRREPAKKTIDIEPENPEDKFGEASIDDIMKKAVEHGAKSIGEVYFIFEFNIK